MNLDNITVGEIRELSRVFNPNGETSHPYSVGENYLIRTVTMTQVGKLVMVTPQELVLEGAAWIADTGRFYDCFKTGDFNEVEPFPAGQVVVGRGAIVDACIWQHQHPTVQK
jgi:hypothetical protein